MRNNRFVRLVVAGLVLAVAVMLDIAVPAGAAAHPGVTLSPSSGPAGSSVTVSGSGFPRQTSGTVTAGSASVSFTTRNTGSFTAVVTIPETLAATVAVAAKTGTASASAPFTVTFSAVSATAGRAPAGPEAAAPATQTAAPTSGTPPVSPARLRFGVSTPGGPLATGELNDVAALVNENPSIVMSYKDFAQVPPISELNSVDARGAASLVTWEPWLWGGGTSQPAYSLARITAGDYDTYLRQWGTALASWGKPVMLRFAHEMNGSWYPWAESTNGNHPGDYANAWRHVHDVVAGTGASNVSWVWSPNVPYWGSTPLAGLYPGAGYADIVALDGYNWGTAASWSSWTAPSALFGDGLAALRSLAPGKPVIIAETSSAEAGGSKADWNTALVSYLAAQSDITAFVWFDQNKEVDWRINSSTGSTNAMAAALAARNH